MRRRRRTFCELMMTRKREKRKKREIEERKERDHNEIRFLEQLFAGDNNRILACLPPLQP